MSVERIERELALLRAGNQVAEFVQDASRPVILYKDVPTSGSQSGLPSATDVIVPVPNGYL